MLSQLTKDDWRSGSGLDYSFSVLTVAVVDPLHTGSGSPDPRLKKSKVSRLWMAQRILTCLFDSHRCGGHISPGPSYVKAPPKQFSSFKNLPNLQPWLLGIRLQECLNKAPPRFLHNASFHQKFSILWGFSYFLRFYKQFQKGPHEFCR